MAKRAGIEAGRAFVRIAAEDSEFHEGLKRAEYKLRSFGSSMQAIGMTFMAVGATITAPLILAARHFVTVGDELDKMSKRTGIAAQDLDRLAWAADRSGASAEDLETGIKRMQRSLSDAAQGLVQAQRNFGRLELNAAELARLSPEKQFEAIARAIARIPDPSKRAAAAQEIFGRSGTKLLPLFRDMDELAAKYRETFGELGDDYYERAAEMQDATTDVKKSLSLLAMEIGMALVPAMRDAAKWIIQKVKWVRDWTRENADLIRGLAKLGVILTAVGAALVGLGLAAKAVATVIAVIKGLTIAINALSVAFSFLMAHPLVAVLVAIAAAGTAIYFAFRRAASGAEELRGAMDDLNESLDEQADRMREIVRGVARREGIEEALRLLGEYRKSITEELPGIPGMDPRARRQWKAAIDEMEKELIGAEKERSEKTIQLQAEIAALREDEAGRHHAAELMRLDEKHRQEVVRLEELGTTEDELALTRQAHELEHAALVEKHHQQEVEDDERKAEKEYREWQELEDARLAQAGRVEDLELQAAYEGFELKKRLLALEIERRRIAAAGQEDILRMLDEEWALRLALLQEEEERAERTAREIGNVSLTTFSGFASRLMGQSAPAVKETEKVVKNTARIAEILQEIKQGGGLVFAP